MSMMRWDLFAPPVRTSGDAAGGSLDRGEFAVGCPFGTEITRDMSLISINSSSSALIDWLPLGFGGTSGSDICDQFPSGSIVTCSMSCGVFASTSFTYLPMRMVSSSCELKKSYKHTGQLPELQNWYSYCISGIARLALAPEVGEMTKHRNIDCERTPKNGMVHWSVLLIGGMSRT